MDSDNVPVQRSGSILLAATPIGDTNDASPKLIRALAEADLVAAEDTRRILKLATRLGVRINGDIKSLHEHNENERVDKVLHRAEDGERVLIVSDAGMPTISDPGYRVVSEAAKRGIPVSALPGPSAVLTALSVSGLPTDRFCFEGFIPRKQGERERRLDDLKEEPRTMVFFDSPKRIHENLTDMANIFGGARKAVLCRELTKTHEEIIRGDLNHLIYATRDDVKGELTLVVAGADPRDKSAEDYVAKVIALAEGGMKLKAAAKLVSEETGVRKNELYRAALARKPE
ncbi:16S rRNA (cytidine(1402)-2'-O)-methyltransferase [Gleimia europaea]|uniref:16S rRNA (cytidine(1402)-2'-O)-methyltransferase n=1 Tax=Gleimia europaea TaxID=66228 RepID=UPI000C80CC66|nr:16S rRNA (cytidine(1402)-2'-O)-methyltransferase [Gleimia europaea]MBS6102832.1 16S rRNA (cytidine(1402)-2'-O)-methyltransferase [Actinomyces sp.]MDP9834015.1 16S rRNA (cytidine1402-2'-O)-methyltransferase [Gleimia europaea]MDU4287253.1 16S rRNA (cytidine(1402)-2'-O)-methyltransferase [Actinomyces sp.]WIK63076.1 16S rRNA (cytidine(1402)-2'-O)-methyltransferase [Gleimia europaea]